MSRRVATLRTEGQHGTIHIIARQGRLTLKQNDDLLRLTHDEARELAEDILDALAQFDKEAAAR